MNKVKNRVVGASILIGDFLLFYISLYLALFIRKGGSPDIDLFYSLQAPFLYLFFIWALVFFVLDFYELDSFKKTVPFLRGMIVFSLIATLLGTFYFYFQPQLDVTPRAILFLTVINFTVISSLWRIVLLNVAGSKSFQKKALFVGFCKEMEEIIERESLDYEFVGIYTKDEVPKKIKEKIKVVDDIALAKKLLEKVDVLILSPEIKNDKEAVKKIFTSFSLNMKYMEFSSLYEEIVKKVPLRSLDEWWFLENISRPQRKMNDIISRIPELIVSLVGVIVLIFLFPFFALLIKIDSRGPVLYRQKRIGEKGKEFVLYKFRTMHYKENEKPAPWREEKDGEVTRIGLLLRNNHLDELPQFYNIIKGDLGFVGPRPEMSELSKHFEENIPFYRLRYLVRPGLTGWAQINYPPSKSIEEAEEKFKYDLYYIKNRSFFFDIVIIIKTIRAIF